MQRARTTETIARLYRREDALRRVRRRRRDTRIATTSSRRERNAMKDTRETLYDTCATLRVRAYTRMCMYVRACVSGRAPTTSTTTAALQCSKVQPELSASATTCRGLGAHSRHLLFNRCTDATRRGGARRLLDARVRSLHPSDRESACQNLGRTICSPSLRRCMYTVLAIPPEASSAVIAVSLSTGGPIVRANAQRARGQLVVGFIIFGQK